MNLRRLSLYRTKVMVSARDFGTKHALRRMLEEVLLRRFFYFRQYIIYEKQLTDVDRPRLRNPHLEFSFISQDSYEILRQMEKLSGFSRELVTRKLKDGSECLVAKDKNELVGFNLVNYGNVYITCLDQNLTLLDSEVWSEQISVLPQHRRSGIATDLRQIMFHHLAEKGYAKLIGGYVPFNVRSGMLAKKLGFLEKEKVTFVKILRWKKYFVHSLLPIQQSSHNLVDSS